MVQRSKSVRKLAGAASVEQMLRLERLLWDLGKRSVAGVDEVGIGPLAGPVVAAAVVFAPDHEPVEVDDSKKLSAARRDALAPLIYERAAAVGVGTVEVGEVDELGVYHAGHEAMRRAVVAVTPVPDYLLVDARRVPGVEIGQSAYTGADGFIYSVAAASIVAKVHRDALMQEMEIRYPGYGFGRHMGYGTAAHMAALADLGPCEIHRRSFEPVRKALRQHGR